MPSGTFTRLHFYLAWRWQDIFVYKFQPKGIRVEGHYEPAIYYGSGECHAEMTIILFDLSENSVFY